MKKLFLTLMFTLIAFPVYAYELLMFQMPSCIYCQRFLSEVAPEWNTTLYGKKLPLRVIDISGTTSMWFSKALQEGRIDGISGTPTFIIWDDNHEVARYVGYSGKTDFYKMVHKFLKSNEDKFGPLDTSPTKLEKFPNGVYKSRDIMDHQYDTEIEAQTAAKFLGCFGTHTHFIKGKTIHMPCKME